VNLVRRITLLRILLGTVIAVQSLRIVLAGAPAGGTHVASHAFVWALAGVEALAAVLVTMPWTSRPGAWLLLVVFGVAVLFHLVHGDPNVGWLLVGVAALLVVLGAPDRLNSQPSGASFRAPSRPAQPRVSEMNTGR